MSKSKQKKVAKPVQPLLVELLVEELPPKLIPSLAQEFANGLLAALQKKNFADADADAASYATPRRIAAEISACRSIIPATEEKIPGPSVDASVDKDNKPTKTLEGFAAAHNCSVNQLTREMHNGRECFVAIKHIPELQIDRALSICIESVANRIQAPRLMFWGKGEYRFVRPVRGLLVILGDQALANVSAFGVKASKASETKGHRARADADYVVNSAFEYENVLRKKHQVIVSHEARCKMIYTQLHSESKKLGQQLKLDIAPLHDDNLIDVNAAMCEHPQVYTASFGSKFLDLPTEVINCCLRNHMRCFLLGKSASSLVPHFLFVSDNKPKSPAKIINGFARVVNARLADAKFCWDTDNSRPESFYHEKLKSITYHSKLGSIADRIDRVEKMTDVIYDSYLFPANSTIEELPSNPEQVKDDIRSAIKICKLDLATLMYREYPELEGILAGRYFLSGINESSEIRTAVETHADRGYDKELSVVRVCLVMALEIERLVGLRYAGESLSGSKDPYGMRRSAKRLASICALWETKQTRWNVMRGRNPSDLRRLLEELIPTLLEDLGNGETDPATTKDYVEQIIKLVLARIKSEPAEILGLQEVPQTNFLNFAMDDALDLSQSLSLYKMQSTFAALNNFYKSGHLDNLVESQKRVANFLKKNSSPDAQDEWEIREDLLTEEVEKLILSVLANNMTEKPKAATRLDWNLFVLGVAAGALSEATNKFFNEVHINCEDAELRKARLDLLRVVNHHQTSVIDFAKI